MQGLNGVALLINIIIFLLLVGFAVKYEQVWLVKVQMFSSFQSS